MSECKLTKDDFLDLYKCTIDEEHKELEMHQSRVAFLTGLISALFAATFVGVTQADEWHEYAFLYAGPILIIGLALVGRVVSTQFYVRFLDAVTMRAKLEQRLGLTSGPHLEVSAEEVYWQNEPFVPTRHLNSRRDPRYNQLEHEGIEYAGSLDWVKEHLLTGYNKSALRLFNTMIRRSGAPNHCAYCDGVVLEV